MRKNAQVKYSAVALAAIGLWLLWLIWDGRITEFVDPHLAILIFPAGLVCVILAQVVLSSAAKPRQVEPHAPSTEAEDFDVYPKWAGWGLIWIAIPLIIGILFP